VLLDNRLADRKSESGAALLARVGWIDLAKPLEDLAPMDGAQTIAALRMQKETATTPVIFLTAKTTVAEIKGMKDLGAAGVLIKPFDPRTLAADVRALLA